MSGFYFSFILFATSVSSSIIDISKRPPFFYYFILSVAADDSFITLKYDRCAGKNEIKVWPAPNNKELNAVHIGFIKEFGGRLSFISLLKH